MFEHHVHAATADAAAATHTQVDDDIKFGMIEAISHLIHRDYEAIVQDFVTLQFIPPGTDLKPILPVLAKVFDQVCRCLRCQSPLPHASVHSCLLSVRCFAPTASFKLKGVDHAPLLRM